MQRLLASLLLISFFSISGMVEFPRLDLERMANESAGTIIFKKIGESSVVDYTLPKECTSKMNELVGDQQIDPYKNWEHYRIHACEVLNKVLPAQFLAMVQNMRHYNQPTALIVHNMPVDENIPETPSNGNRPPCKEQPDGKGYVSEMSLLGLCSLLGAHPDYDENEKDGTYINQIIPRDDNKSKMVASSFGSETPFYPHTENVYSEPPLKFFSLLCLRGDPKVATSMIFLDHILAYVKNYPHFHSCTNDFVLNEMEKPQFLMRSGPSFEGKKGREVILPILTTNEKGERVFRFNANPNRVSATNDSSDFVVNHLKTILTSPAFINKYKTSVRLNKGDLLLFNNWEVMHARDSFKIDKDNWRWLQRCYFMLDEDKK